jgi:hypothetical protein
MDAKARTAFAHSFFTTVLFVPEGERAEVYQVSLKSPKRWIWASTVMLISRFETLISGEEAKRAKQRKHEYLGEVMAPQVEETLKLMGSGDAGAA